eukprot:gene10231-13763_t
MSELDTPFQVLFQRAATLKTASQAVFRKKYNSYPPWYQHSLFSQQDIINARKLSQFDELYEFSSTCKIIGNQYFESGDYMEAIDQYERALSLFKWIESMEEDWKRKEIDDDKLLLLEYQPKNNDEISKINQLFINCYLNLAVCYQKMNEWMNSIRACDAVLELDNNNIKAYYRRAQARILPLSCGTIDNQQALKDLKQALSIDSTNKSVLTAYKKLKNELSKQINIDKKVFNNLFDREDGINNNNNNNNDSNQDTMTYQEALDQLADMESAATRYERDGDIIAAQNLRDRINSIQHTIDSYIQHNKANKLKETLLSPSNNDIEEAKKNGLDLKDERVSKILKAITESTLSK